MEPEPDLPISDAAPPAPNVASPPESKKPKRHYVLTERRLAANRANLTKARAKRWAPSLKHGFFARQLRRSLPWLGETVAKFDAHVRRFQQAFRPTDPREERLVAAMAQTAWLRLRVFRLKAMEEALVLKARLVIAATLAPLAGRGMREARGLMLLLLEVFEACPEVSERLGRLNRRFERLGRLVLEGRGELPPGKESSDATARLRRLATSPPSAEDDVRLGNPMLGAVPKPEAAMSEAVDAAERRQRPVMWREEADPEIPYINDNDWPPRLTPTKQPCRVLRYPEALAAGLDPAEWPAEEEQKLVALLRQVWLELGRVFEPSGRGWPDSIEEYQRLIERAFDSELRLADREQGNLDVGADPRLEALAHAAWARLQVYREQAEEEEQKLGELLEKQETGDRGELTVSLDAEATPVACSLTPVGCLGVADPSDPQGSSAATATLLRQILLLFAGCAAVFFLAMQRRAELQAKVYRWCQQRYGRSYELRGLRPAAEWLDPRRRAEMRECLLNLYESDSKTEEE